MSSLFAATKEAVLGKISGVVGSPITRRLVFHRCTPSR